MRDVRKSMLAALALAAALVFQAVPATAYAENFPTEVSGQAVTEQATSSAKTAAPVLQDGTAVIPSDATPEQVKEILCAALVANAGEVDPQSLEWEYYCEGSDTSTGWTKNSAWGSINGFQSEKKVVFVTTTYNHPALKDNDDGSYRVRLAGSETEVTLGKVAKLQSALTLNQGAAVTLPYNEDASVNYDSLRASLFSALVSSSDPEGLTASDVTVEYYATAKTGAVGDLGRAWMPLEGGTKSGLSYPAISAGEQQIRISYGGNDTYYGVSAETAVTISERSEAPYVLNETFEPVTLVVDESLNVDFATLKSSIFSSVVASSEVLTADNVTVEYYATAKTGAVGDLGRAWMPLEGGTKSGLSYPAISAGEQQIRISWPGSQTYAPTAIEVTLVVQDRPQVTFNLNEGPYEVGMAFNEDQSYDYEGTARAIFDAVVASTEPVLAYEDVTVEYNADPTGLIDSWKPLDEAVIGDLGKFGVGEHEIRISWGGNQAYRGGSVTVGVTTTDNRIASSVALLADASITYNMDANVMKQELFDNAIDWASSTLPARETLSVDDFTFEYYGEATLFDGGVASGIRSWTDVAGKDYTLGSTTLGSYPQLPAGEQQVRITYKGNADYRPSEGAEGAVSVAKASVKVSVKSTNIFADEAVPEGFITTNPADEFDIYTIYAGATSDVTTGIYLDLPERFADNGFIKLIDPIVEAIRGESFTEMLNNGVTLGELRELFSAQELLDILDKLNIDTGTFGQILSVINGLPSIVDGVRVSFGTPNRAGLYTVFAVTDNANYNTGVGFGMLLVKMRLSGTHLTWNQGLGSKISAADAANFDFGATLSYNGDTTISQDNVHVLYSGFTSKWRIYSSTSTPPTEPGRYVMTVVTLGGNYLAAPITRSFQITK